MTMTRNNSNSRKVIIFDWDDTICPSSFVDKWKADTFNDLPLHFHNLLTEIGKCAEKCLQAAEKFGEVIIITNSDEGWVQFSAEKYIPYLLPVVANYRIVSARTRYEQFYPGQPLCWKAAAFAHEVNERFLIAEEEKCMKKNIDVRREVISFGDSMEERTAVKIVAGQLSCVPKSVMFITSPTPIQLIGQLTMLTGQMKFVCESKKTLDLEINAQQAQKCADIFFKDNDSSQQSLFSDSCHSASVPPINS